MDAQTKNRILITGSSGLLGTTITENLSMPWSALHHGQEGWDPENGVCDPAHLDGVSAVIHLAGEPIANKRWSKKQKQKIYDSRVNGTRALATAMAQCDAKPSCLICASAIGYYGDRGEEVLTEASSPGNAFISNVVKDWEAATAPAREAGIRVVHLRLGIVLAKEGGALAKMLPVFKWGLGGRLGNGKMWMSWIHVDDAANAFQFALDNPDLHGSLNLCAPSPIRNSDFTRILASVLGKPAFLPVPAPIIKVLLGEMGKNLLLSSTRVVPEALTHAGFTFTHPEADNALEKLLQS